MFALAIYPFQHASNEMILNTHGQGGQQLLPCYLEMHSFGCRSAGNGGGDGLAI